MSDLFFRQRRCLESVKPPRRVRRAKAVERTEPRTDDRAGSSAPTDWRMPVQFNYPYTVATIGHGQPFSGGTIWYDGNTVTYGSTRISAAPILNGDSLAFTYNLNLASNSSAATTATVYTPTTTTRIG